METYNKLSYDYVYDYIKSKNCELISKEYKNYGDKLEVKCSCGETFERSFNKFKDNNQTRCSKCINKPNWDYKKVKNFIEVESESNCKLISKEYINRNQKLEIMCNCGNFFVTDFSTFLHGNKRKCDLCATEIRLNKKRKGIDYLRDYVKQKSNTEILTNTYKNFNDIFNFRCECGREFSKTFYAFMISSMVCDFCTGSIMEKRTRIFFERNNIDFIQEYTINDLVCDYNNIPLRFDFAIFKNGEMILLELDGEQHFKPIEYLGGIEKFERLQKNDKKKNDYCKQYNIKLYRISYKHKRNLEEKLREIFL